MMPNTYPEHERLKAIKDKSQAIGEFLEWLDSHPSITLCDIDSNHDYFPTHVTNNTLLAEYFGIDLAKLENEKQLMLDEFRKKTK
jgi:hypothetical protein